MLCVPDCVLTNVSNDKLWSTWLKCFQVRAVFCSLFVMSCAFCFCFLFNSQYLFTKVWMPLKFNYYFLIRKLWGNIILLENVFWKTQIFGIEKAKHMWPNLHAAKMPAMILFLLCSRILYYFASLFSFCLRQIILTSR